MHLHEHPNSSIPLRRQLVLIACIAVATVVMTRLGLHTGVSVDLLPLWIAADFFHSQQWSAIYANDSTYFTMTAPVEWQAYLNANANDIDAQAFPYVYPPLWAGLFAPLTSLTTYANFDWIVGLVNPVLIVLIPYFAWRAAPVISLPVHMAMALIIILPTSVGLIPLIGNQMQIFVALLSVLAVERARNGHQITAGAVLALAAAIKLYPAIFVFMFFATGQRRAAIAFAVTGACLALLSLFVAGWPLHLDFLSQISAISRTVMLVNLSMSVDGLIAQLFFSDQAFSVPLHPGRVIVEKTEIWLWISRIALVLLILGLLQSSRRNPAIARNVLIWPLAFICCSLLAPLSWSYHYLAPIGFAPLLLTSTGYLRGFAFLSLISISVSMSMLRLNEFFPDLALPLQISGTLGMLALAAAKWRQLYLQSRDP